MQETSDADEGIIQQLVAMVYTKHYSGSHPRRYWSNLDQQFRKHDQQLVRKWKESMDILLVFVSS